MNITSAQYIRNRDDTDNIVIVANIDGQNMEVPLDPANRHYAAILEWVAEGNTIQDAD
tara:strand:- start:23023 stop:23196 length:174 start_codon:yes stop_codon:yes gene_type:complete